jgi:hypothetical protein
MLLLLVLLLLLLLLPLLLLLCKENSVAVADPADLADPADPADPAAPAALRSPRQQPSVRHGVRLLETTAPRRMPCCSAACVCCATCVSAQAILPASRQPAPSGSCQRRAASRAARGLGRLWRSRCVRRGL